MSKENYYSESGAVDMCIDRMRLHCGCCGTVQKRAEIASLFMAPAWPEYERLLNAILYGPPDNDGDEQEEFFEEAQDEKNDM